MNTDCTSDGAFNAFSLGDRWRLTSAPKNQRGRNKMIEFYIATKNDQGNSAGVISFRLGALLFEGMSEFQRDLPIGYKKHTMYPEPQALRQRLGALKADPAPVAATVNEETYWRGVSDGERKGRTAVAAQLDKLETFVSSCEAAFANVTPWEPVYETPDWEFDDKDFIADADSMEEEDHADVFKSPEEIPGREVEWGDPGLMSLARGKPTGERHRYPYIVFCT